MKVYYICDKKACDYCVPGCTHTSDIAHAKNFETSGTYVIEKEGDNQCQKQS